MAAYYNENDKNAAAWLRELIKQNLIAPGDVDERSIADVRANDLNGYTQCHFFAGIGVWSYALRRAGWDDSRPVWTGSCPCQPFSTAGKQRGVDDERHLWPEFYRLIKECRPPVVFGEQVASKDGLAWLDTVQADMEASNYATAAADLCAASIGAPHIRQRLFFVSERLGNTIGTGLERHWRHERVNDSQRRATTERQCTETSVPGGLADTPGDRRPGQRARPSSEKRRQTRPDERRELAQRFEGRTLPDREADALQRGDDDNSDSHNSYWANPDWLYCGDNKWRPVEPGTSPLANGTPARVVRLRGYGNAINAEVAKVFIESAQEALGVLKQ